MFPGYEGYITTSIRIDLERRLQSLLFDIMQFPSPHTGNATADILAGVIEESGTGTKVNAKTTDNVSAVCEGFCVAPGCDR